MGYGIAVRGIIHQHNTYNVMEAGYTCEGTVRANTSMTHTHTQGGLHKPHTRSNIGIPIRQYLHTPL